MLIKIMKHDNPGKTIDMSMGYDCKGRMVCRSVKPVVKSIIEGGFSPFADCDFISLNREDAENILWMLNYAISKLESGNRTDNDVEVFGDKAISYERLIDALDYTVY